MKSIYNFLASVLFYPHNNEMKKFTFILLLVAFNSSCVKTGLGTVNLFAKFGHFKRIKNIAYADHELNQLNLYLPKKKEIKATILFFYGGCWGQCSNLKKDNYLLPTP